MTVSIVTVSIFLLAASAFADNGSSRAKLKGNWQQSGGNGQTESTWTLEGAGDSIHVTNRIGTETVAEFTCNTMGKECIVKDAGRAAKVSIWFNGPKLVEMETRGSQVVKRRFCITGDGDTLDLETIPIEPAGQTETTHFKRVPAIVAKP